MDFTKIVLPDDDNNNFAGKKSDTNTDSGNLLQSSKKVLKDSNSVSGVVENDTPGNDTPRNDTPRNDTPGNYDGVKFSAAALKKFKNDSSESLESVRARGSIVDSDFNKSSDENKNSDFNKSFVNDDIPDVNFLRDSFFDDNIKKSVHANDNKKNSPVIDNHKSSSEVNNSNSSNSSSNNSSPSNSDKNVSPVDDLHIRDVLYGEKNVPENKSNVKAKVSIDSHSSDKSHPVGDHSSSHDLKNTSDSLKNSSNDLEKSSSDEVFSGVDENINFDDSLSEIVSDYDDSSIVDSLPSKPTRSVAGLSRKRSGKSKSKKKRIKTSDPFREVLASEELVDDNGRVPSDSIENVSRAKTESSSSSGDWAGVERNSKYSYTRRNGRLNKHELMFFKNINTSIREFSDQDMDTLFRSPPPGVAESRAQKKERLRRISRAIGGKEALKRGSKFRLSEKDIQILQFLAMFRYATALHISRMFSVKEGTGLTHLKKLYKYGLVADKNVYGVKPIWFLTDVGMLLSGFDLPRVSNSNLSFSMFPHQFTVNNTASNLWGANVNVLNFDTFPLKNRINAKGERVFGETLVSELEIQSSFGKYRKFDKADVYRPHVLANIDKEFLKWEQAGGTKFGVSPEQVYGNEYMWALFPPYNVHVAYHVPDLVVKRERAADGSPRSIAVEVEISNKVSDSYRKTLLAYRADKRMYAKVIWVCKNAGVANKLEKIAKDIGLWEENRIDIVPVLTENGVFKGRDLWQI